MCAETNDDEMNTKEEGRMEEKKRQRLFTSAAFFLEESGKYWYLFLKAY